MIDEVTAVLGGPAQFTAALDPPLPDFAVPEAFAAGLTHDPVAKTLTGALTTIELDTLKAAFPTANYKAAIEDLFAQPRTFAQPRMRAYTWPTGSAPLALRARVNFDTAARVLTFDETMSAADKATLETYRVWLVK